MLIDDLKRGSEQAFRALVQEYSAQVIKTCYGFVRHADDAEDIAQEVFIEVARSAGRFRGDAALGTWIYRICINKSLDFVRRQRRQKRLADLRELFRAQSRPGADPARQLEADERRALLRRQIALLPENQRIALVLSQYDGLSNRQIAEIMAVSEKAVESLLHRARANLRRRLARHFEKNP